MGVKSSKEGAGKQDCIPTNFSRGCVLPDYPLDWRNKLKEVSTSPKKLSSKDIILSDSSKNLKNIPSSGVFRLQSIGSNQKSYLQQLVQHRAKSMEKGCNENYTIQKIDDYESTINIEKTSLESGDDRNTNNKQNGYQMVVSKLFKKKGMYTILKAFLTGKEDNLIKEVLSNNKNKVTKPTPNPPKKFSCNIENDFIVTENQNGYFPNQKPSRILHSKPTQSIKKSEVSLLSDHKNGRPNSPYTSSDVSVVSYNQAKARFEHGLHKKVQKKSEAFAQLEELGLGYWRNGRWIPTKIVTPAISDQLCCAEKDWPNTFPFKKNYNNNFLCRAACSEVNE